MPPTQRRPHTKSRLGCQQCKKQRTKCDEKRPSCTRCLRTGLKCSLIDSSSSLFIINTSVPKPRQESFEFSQTSPHNQISTHDAQSQQSTTPPHTIKLSPASDISDVKQQDERPRIPLTNLPIQFSEPERTRLKLMNHYTQFTARSIAELTHSQTDASSILWQVEIPRLAFRNDFLLHGLLSISALHLSLTDPSSEYDNVTLAVEHHNQGIALYTPHLMNITAENIDALFAFACFTGMYSFGIHLKGGLELSPLAKIYEAFTMIAGTGIIVKSGIEWLRAGIWSTWFPTGCEDYVKPLPREVQEAMSKLRRRIDTTITTSSQSEMYTRAIDALEENFRQFHLVPRSQMSIVMLPVLSPPEFQQMVCIGEPLALSILGNWAVILHWLREHVWVSHWGAQTIKTIHETLPPEWRDCIEWAVSEVESSKSVTHLLTPDGSESESVRLTAGYENVIHGWSGTLS